MQDLTPVPAQFPTTEIYTRVCIDQLRQVHAATHPAGRLRPDAPTDPGEADDTGEVT